MNRVRPVRPLGGALIILIALLLALPVSAAPARASVLDPAAAAWLAQAAPNATTTVLVMLRDDAAQSQIDQAAHISDVQTRRAEIYRLLSERSARDTAALNQLTRAQGLARDLRDAKPLAVVGGFVITASKRGIEALSSWDRVAIIELNSTVQIDQDQSRTIKTDTTINAVEWHISKINADLVWGALGYRGQGIVVATVGTGVRYTHEALRNNYKCATLTSHTPCWNDVINNRPTPYDDNNHGTHITGSAVGTTGIGVAPGAKWITCKGLSSTGSGTIAGLATCLNWLMAPGGSSANAPDLVINTWGGPSNSPAIQAAITSLFSAGILSTAPVGASAGCSTIGYPAAYSNVIGVGATDANDVVTSFSSRGPGPGGIIKPDMMAPGINIRSASATSDTSYLTWSGTASPTGIVGGVAALVLSKNPTMSPTALMNNLRTYAFGIAATGCSSSGIPNNIYGWGRVDAYNSVLNA